MFIIARYSFSQVPTANIARTRFNRSHGLKTTFDAGWLIPVFLDEVLPADTKTLKATFFCRMATLATPLMDNLYLDTHFFFVPFRLVWDNFQKFMGEQENPGDSIDYLVPTCTSPEGGYEVQSIYDYLGLPIGVGGLEHSEIPLRCCYLIYNEWFRDENLQDSLEFSKGDNASPNGFQLFRRGKRLDYFTGALPTPVKFVDGIEIPLTGNAPVIGNGMTLGLTNGSGNYGVWQQAFQSNHLIASSGAYGTSVGSDSVSGDATAGITFGVTTDPAKSGMVADLSLVNAATINSLRMAFQMQRLLEKDNRSGTRYVEILRSHFGTISPDARLQRPEYLGGSSTLFMVNTVEQTSATGSGDTPQGNLSAFAVAGSKIHGFTKSFVEHGYIIGFVSVRADLNYQQGLHRLWSRSTRYDFYFPVLAHLGEQAILNKEIYAQGTDEDNAVFGYQERWAEYRYKPNQITGKFRSQYAQSLDVWHLAQDFSELPKLNSEFIVDNPPVDRVIAVQDEPQFLLDAYYKMYDVRPMPMYSVPGFIDHF